MKIFVAADHAGFALKEQLKAFISAEGHEVIDSGALTLVPGDDYPDYVLPCAKEVAQNPGSFGIIIGASGEGEAMAANRIPGVRAAVYYGTPKQNQTDSDGASLSLLESVRAHNDANILSLGARFLSQEEAEGAVRVFLTTPFSGDARHIRRIEKF